MTAATPDQLRKLADQARGYRTPVDTITAMQDNLRLAADALAAVAAARDRAQSERDGAEGQLQIRSDEAYEQRVRANRAESLLDEALLMIRNAPHGPHCSSRIAVPEPPRYGCDCWRAGL